MFKVCEMCGILSNVSNIVLSLCYESFLNAFFLCTVRGYFKLSKHSSDTINKKNHFNLV